MVNTRTPDLFGQLLAKGCICESDILETKDGFFLVYKSVADILAGKEIFDFPDSAGEIFACSSFYDDWFLFAVADEASHTYSLLKLREQEHDTEDGAPADGDTPGVTISFISFAWEKLLTCLDDPIYRNRQILNTEINRVVAYSGQRHHKSLKKYFVDPKSEGAYLVADLYTRHIASFAESGRLPLSECYKDFLQQSISYKTATKQARLPKFIEKLNRQAGYEVCDSQYIYIQDPANPSKFERAAILATHTGNTSVFSFAAEVEYHARFLIPLAKVKIPFFGNSIYASAIRADMTVGDTEFEGPAPFYRADSRIVKRQYHHHKDKGNL